LTADSLAQIYNSPAVYSPALTPALDNPQFLASFSAVL
jgi:hypothetical protein